MPTPTATATGSGRTGALRGVGSRRCLRAAKSTKGSPVTIYACDGSAGEQWTLTAGGRLTVYGNRCLYVPAGATQGARVRISACVGATAQRWTRNADGTVVNRATGLVLDVVGGRTADGTPVAIWSRHGGTNQRWAWH
jgi:hypothetical protein